jgi:hypothetical protein
MGDTKMSREVSVEEQIKRVENRLMLRQVFAPNTIDESLDRGYAHDKAILATLRRSVLLERVAEAAKDFDIYASKVPYDLEGNELYRRVQARLAALRDHDKLGKEG